MPFVTFADWLEDVIDEGRFRAFLSKSLVRGSVPDADLRALPDAACPQEGYAPLSPADLESLVAPIALYPDELVAQVLGAATYPEQITEAHDWLQWNSGLQGQALMWGDPRSTINNETHVSVKCVSPSKNSLQEQARRWRRWWRRERHTRRSSRWPTWRAPIIRSLTI